MDVPVSVSEPVVARLQQASRACAIVVAAVAALVLVGWVLDVPAMKSLHPGWATMKANTAVCFALLGIALSIVGSTSQRKGLRIVRFLATISFTIAALTLSQDLFGWELHIDELLFRDPASLDRAGRMSVITAILLMTLSTGVIRLQQPPVASHVAQVLGLLGSIVATVALCGYLYGVQALYGIPGFGSVSILTTSCSLLLAFSVLGAQPRGGVMAVLSANTLGGSMARRIFPLVVIAPIALGTLSLLGERGGLFDAPFGLALYAVANIVALGTIAWFASRRLTDSESRHRQSLALLQGIGDNSLAVIYAKDLDGRYLLVNRRFTELFRMSAEQVLGKTDYDLFAPQDADRFRSLDQRVASGSVALTEEELVPVGDGAHTYLSVKNQLRDDAGHVYAVFGISTDITDRKQAEATLRASEERTRLIIEAALDAVITMDTAGAITGWSQHAEKTFGWTREEVLGCPLAERIIPERYREAHRRGLQHFLMTGEGPVLNTRLELAGLHRDGQEFPIELSIATVRIGDAVSFSAFVRDITERKRVEAELVESQQHYQMLAESLPHLVWTCRPDGYCDFLSRQWVEYTGRPAAEQLGSGWAHQLHPDDRERVQSAWAEATARGDTFDIEFRIRRADGAYRWFKTRAVPLRDASGRIVKWFGSNTDFDDFMRVEQRLRAQLERLNLLDRLTRAIGERQDLQSILQVAIGNLEDQLPLDLCAIGLYDRADASLLITQIGPKSQSLANQIGVEHRTRIPIDQSGLSRCVRGQLVHEPDLTQLAFPFPQRLASVGLQSLVAAPLAVESNVFGVLIAARRPSPGFSSAECEFLRQLSEHVALAAHQAELYQALQRAYDDLRQTQQAVSQQERLKALGQMASGIAHDINNAISPVALYTETLIETEPGLSQQAREYLMTIQRAIEDVSQTVARMREFYREREPQLALAAVAVNRVVRDVVQLTRARWSDMPQQRGLVIQVATELAPSDPVVLGVESEIREALINLVFNAIDAMPDGGRLTLRTQVDATEAGGKGAGAVPSVRIEVNDTGIGMNADTRRRCLEPFFTTKGERGTGLGLAMVYGTVQRHAGDLSIESTPGQGTTMRLSFAAAPTEKAAASRPQTLRSPTRLRVLVVDDDPLLLKTLRDVLERDGHIVTTATGGQAGIDILRSTQHDGGSFAVVITDLGMPHVDGRQVAARVKEVAASTPVILLTGWGQRLLDDGDVPPHVDRVLNKPPRLVELRAALAELTAPSPGDTL